MITKDTIKMKFFTSAAPALLAALLACSAAGAADLVKLRVNVQAEKRNATVNFKQGAIASIGVDASIINGFSGSTSDFGAELPLYLIFQEPLDFEEAAKLAEYQFRLEGKATCQLVQKGNSPDVPGVKLAVLAQNCKVTAINH